MAEKTEAEKKAAADKKEAEEKAAANKKEAEEKAAANKKAEDAEKADEGKLPKLVVEACKAYGIAPKYLLGSNVVNGEAVLVTHGGAKVRYRAGDEVQPLDKIRVTGINPENAKRKPVVGKKR